MEISDFSDLVQNLKKFKGITADSKTVKNGFVFVAVKGITSNGHDYIDDALKNGASIVVGDEPRKESINYIRVKDSRDALGTLASEFYGNPSGKLKVIGVTGTKGKTTTVHLIYHMLFSAGKKVGLVSSNMAKIGEKESAIGFHVTSPDVISLHKFLKEMVDADCEYAVIEVSSHGIAQKRIAGVNFEAGVLTNIAPEHLDYHKTFEEYKNVKMSFLNSAKIKVVGGTASKLNILPGEFNNINAETAVQVVKYFGISENEALKALRSFRLPEGRLEEIKNNLGLSVFVDFAHTPESLEAVLRYLKTFSKGRVISVFGSAGERDCYKRPKMGQVAANFSDVIILTAEDPRSEKVEDIMEEIKKGITNSEVEVFAIADRKTAIAKAFKLARRGDTVGIFGKGHEKSMNLDGMHEIPWSDQKIVREYIGK